MRKKTVKKTGRDIKYLNVPDEPGYHPEEDIYQQEKKVPFQEEDLTGDPVRIPVFLLADDLDIPGTELDDRDEMIGEEDEENNYYSLGGDNHHDLDEDRGD